MTSHGRNCSTAHDVYRMLDSVQCTTDEEQHAVFSIYAYSMQYIMHSMLFQTQPDIQVTLSLLCMLQFYSESVNLNKMFFCRILLAVCRSVQPGSS